MNQKENSELKKIAKHVEILNSEMGNIQNDIRWLKKLVFYMAGIVSVGVGKVIFFG